MGGNRTDIVITLATKLTPAPTVQVREVDGEIVVLDTAQNRFAGLNQVGARIWGLLAEGKVLSDVVTDLSARYPAVPQETLEADILRLAGEFHERGWMCDATPSSASGRA
jgi:hypothetical protein